MALWSIMSAPLILSVDLRTISSWARDIILNKNLIAINQDPLGIMGRRILQVEKSIFFIYNSMCFCVYSYKIRLKYGVNHC